MQVRIEP